MASNTARVERFTPRYFEIEQALRSRISSLQAHDALPSDAELCTEFGVSRMTARAAVQNLVNDGLVYRISGSGTFVAPPLVDRQLSNLRGFSAEMKARGLEPSSVVLEAKVKKVSPTEVKALDIEPGSEIVRIRRIRRADNQPLVLETTTLTRDCMGVLEADLATGSLHEALLEQGLLPTSGTSLVTAVLANAEDAKHLSVKSGSPLLVEQRLILDPKGRPIEWTESRYVPERYNITAQFTVELPASSN